MDSEASTPIGTASTHGDFTNDTFPRGIISFDSGTKPLNLVAIVVPFQQQGAVDFLIDTIIIITQP